MCGLVPFRGEKWWYIVFNEQFLGQYKYNLDSKGRIVIPNDYRNILGNRVVVNKGIEKCITVYPEDEFARQAERISQLAFTQKVNRSFKRYFLSSAFKKELDSQGRINLEECLIEYAGIKKECVIVGAGNVIEIWNAEDWAVVEEERNSNLEDISEDINF